jgi:nitrogenase subunit NifH
LQPEILEEQKTSDLKEVFSKINSRIQLLYTNRQSKKEMAKSSMTESIHSLNLIKLDEKQKSTELNSVSFSINKQINLIFSKLSEKREANFQDSTNNLVPDAPSSEVSEEFRSLHSNVLESVPQSQDNTIVSTPLNEDKLIELLNENFQKLPQDK